MKYSVLVRKMRERIHDFSGKLSTRFSRPKARFVEEVLYGLTAGRDVKLSSIGRSLEEDVPLGATEKRLSRNLATEGMDDILREELLGLGRRRVHKDTLVVVDISDIRKPYAAKMEHLARVRDGSTGELVDGYWTLNVVACEQGESRIVPLYQKLYSAKAEGFESENAEILAALDMISEAVGGRGIWVVDRGGDRIKLLRPMLAEQKRFIVRLRGDRHLLFRGHMRRGREIAQGCPMHYAEHIVKESSEGEKGHHIQYGYRKVKLPGRDEQLYMVVVKGFAREPMMLLTNLPMRKRRGTLWQVVGGYLTRWRIEEAIRFIKQSYNLEDIRVLSYQRLKNLVALVLAAAYFTACYLGYNLHAAVLARCAIKASRRLFGVAPFRYYALADGIAVILAHATCGPIRTKTTPHNTGLSQMELQLQ